MASSDVDPILVDEGGDGDENSEDTQDKGEVDIENNFKCCTEIKKTYKPEKVFLCLIRDKCILCLIRGLHFCVTSGPFCINRKMPINRIYFNFNHRFSSWVQNPTVIQP